VTSNDGPRRPDRSQGWHDQGQGQKGEQDSRDGEPCEGPSCKNATFDPEMCSLVEGRAGILVGLSVFVFDTDVFGILGLLNSQHPGTDVDFVADGETFAQSRKAIDHDLLSLRGFDVDVSFAEPDRGVVKGGGQALETQIVVWATSDIEGLNFYGVFESDTLSAGAQFDFSEADAQ
jgi:hypothetical protein